MVVEAIHELNPTPAVVQGSSEAPSGMRSAPGSTRSIETGVRSIYSTDELGTGRSLGPASARNAGRSTCQGDNCGADLTGMRCLGSLSVLGGDAQALSA